MKLSRRGAWNIIIDNLVQIQRAIIITSDSQFQNRRFRHYLYAAAITRKS